MSKVTDPDDLDRFQCIFNGSDQKMSLRGQDTGSIRGSVQTNGQTDNTTTFTRAAGDFGAEGVIAGDVLALIDDPAEDVGIMGHYRVVSVDTATTLTVDRIIPNHTGADLTWRITAKQATGGTPAAVADGVSKQAIYSFGQEEWITLAAGLGNAADLNRFTFPIQAISANAGEYIMGGINGAASSAWSYEDVNGTEATDDEGNPRELVRDGGWQERDAADVVLREYVNITTSGALDADTQVNYQQGDATGTPVNFKLLGPVNQPVLTFGPDVGPDAATLGFVITGTDTIARNDGGDFAVDNYRIGDFVTLRSATDPANNGSHGPITAITAGVDGNIVLAGAGLTNQADDLTIILQVDHRLYTELRARKKGRDYVQAGQLEAGIAAGVQILPIINKFPLSHSNDPATNVADNGLDDGFISGGDGSAAGDIFQETELHTTAGADGATTDNGDGTFGFNSVGSTFNNTARGAVGILLPGDSVELTGGTTYLGVYEIQSVDGANDLTLFHEPGRSYPGDETSIDFDVRVGVLDVGSATGDIDDVDGATGTLTDTGSPATFDVGAALGDRIVTTDDILEIISGVGAHVGYYKVVSRTSATVLVIDTSDQIFTTQTGQTYRIWRPGMFLQRFSTLSTTVGPITSIDFNDVDPDTIDRNDGGDFTTDGYNVPGLMLTTTLATVSANNGVRIVASATAGVITLILEETLTADTVDTTAVLNGEFGITRSVNSIFYPFHWRLFAHSGTLLQCFQFLMRELRRETDIDGGNGTERGDITDLLMNFIAPNGTTLDLFPDDLATGDINNSTYQDMSGDDRNEAFIVGITFDVNAALIAATNSRLTAYFTTNPAGNFDTVGAVIVDDKDSVDMDFTAIAADIPTTFDYTNNSQGGRTPDADAAITIVALGDDGAQHIIVTQLITKVNSITIPVNPPGERNYST